MSVYSKLTDVGSRLIPIHRLLKIGFNLSPMYRRSTARIRSVSEDLMRIEIRLPISYKNRNYMNTIFGGSMFAAVDPIPMVQLIHLLGKEYVVWDKAAVIYFKRPANQHLTAEFVYTPEELDYLRKHVKETGEAEIVKVTKLTDVTGSTVYCEVHKTIYVADREHFRRKREQRSQPN